MIATEKKEQHLITKLYPSEDSSNSEELKEKFNAKLLIRLVSQTIQAHEQENPHYFAFHTTTIVGIVGSLEKALSTKEKNYNPKKIFKNGDTRAFVDPTTLLNLADVVCIHALAQRESPIRNLYLYDPRIIVELLSEILAGKMWWHNEMMAWVRSKEGQLASHN